MTNRQPAEIKSVQNLHQLLESILALHEEGRADEIEMDSLPLFSGQASKRTLGVWSWDEKHLLIGDSGFDDLMIVKRADWRN